MNFGKHVSATLPVLLFVAAGFAAPAAHAALLFETSLVSAGGGHISSTLNGSGVTPGFRTADDFVLSSHGLIQQVEWNGSEVAGGLDFTFTFYDDNGGLPGSIQHATGGSLSQPGNDGGDYEATLDSPFSAQAGVIYWLSIYNAAPDAVWGWRVIALNQGFSAQTLDPPGNGWGVGSLERDQAFRLEGVPEPSTLALAGVAFLLALPFRLARGCANLKKEARPVG